MTYRIWSGAVLSLAVGFLAGGWGASVSPKQQEQAADESSTSVRANDLADPRGDDLWGGADSLAGGADSLAGDADSLAGPTDSLAGTWEGTLHVSGIELRLVFHIERAEDGSYSATLDSPDQGANGIPVSKVSFSGGVVTLTSAAVKGVFEGDMSEDGSTIDGKWRQNGNVLPLVVTRVDHVTAAPRPQEPQPPYPYDEEQVSYSNVEAGNELAGTLTLPRGTGPFPAVVLISGSGPQDRDETVFGHRPFWVLADYLTRRGIAVLRFDDRGVGSSTGDLATATTEDFAGDVRAGIAYLRTRPRVDGSRIGLIGHSEGGLIGPMVAADDPDVAFVVMMAGPGLPGSEILERQAALIARAAGASEAEIERNRQRQHELFEIVKQEPDTAVAARKLRAVIREALASMSTEEKERARVKGNADQVAKREARQLNSPWFRFFLSYDPRPTLSRVKAPVLAINGELDLQVPPAADLEEIAKALKAGGNPDFTVKQLPGLNHLFQDTKTGAPSEYARIEQTLSPSALKLIGDWILERVGG